MDIQVVEGKHDADNIRRSVEKLAKDWGIEGKKLFVTTDRGTNIVKACEDSNVLEHIPCL